jgi:hypothetical protein
MTSDLTTVTATSALSRETPTKETPENGCTARRETPETAVDEDRRDYETAEVDQCWSVVASMGQGGRKWVLGSSKAVNTQAGPPCHVRATHIGAWALINRPFPTIFGRLTHIWPTLVGMLARQGQNATASGRSWSRKKALLQINIGYHQKCL